MKGFGRVLRDVKAYVSCQEYVGILLKRAEFSAKQGGTAGIDFQTRP